MMMCESGWTGDRCQLRLHHTSPHSNDSVDAIVAWLEQQPDSTETLTLVSVGHPASEMLVLYLEEHPEHTVRGMPSAEGWPYGTTHDADCQGAGCADTPFTLSPRSETYWSS